MQFELISDGLTYNGWIPILIKEDIDPIQAYFVWNNEIHLLSDFTQLEQQIWVHDSMYSGYQHLIEMVSNYECLDGYKLYIEISDSLEQVRIYKEVGE